MKQMQQGEASPDPNRHINNLSGHIQKNGPALKQVIAAHEKSLGRTY